MLCVHSPAARAANSRTGPESGHWAVQQRWQEGAAMASPPHRSSSIKRKPTTAGITLDMDKLHCVSQAPALNETRSRFAMPVDQSFAMGPDSGGRTRR